MSDYKFYRFCFLGSCFYYGMIIAAVLADTTFLRLMVIIVLIPSLFITYKVTKKLEDANDKPNA